MLFWKSLRICVFHIYHVYALGMLLQTCFSMSSRKDSSLLSEIREPVWSYILDVCSSFLARVCNACLSQIFKKRTFGYLNEEEESFFMTLSTFYSFCSSGSNFVTLSSSIFLTVVKAYGLNQLGLDNNMWPLLVTKMHRNPGRLNCANIIVILNHAIRKTLLYGCDDKFILLVS